MDEAERDSDGASRRPVAAAVLAMIACVSLLLFGTLGVYNPSALVWVDRLANHPFVFGVAAIACFCFAVIRLARRRWATVVVCLLGGSVAALWVGVGVVWVFLDGDEVAVVQAPPGPGASYEVVVRDGVQVIDPIWEVSVRQTGSLLAREWAVGCISGDDSANSFKAIAWDSRDLLRVTTSERSVIVPVDTRNGKPDPNSDSPWNTCQY